MFKHILPLSLPLTLALSPACSEDRIDFGDSVSGDDTEATTGTDDTGQDISATGIYEETSRNLLVISIDTFRPDYMTRYGSDEVHTPFLDGIAEESVALDRHTSCSNWTFPSVLCALSGRYNYETGFFPRLSSGYREQAPANRWSLAGHLKDQGYYTLFVASNSWLGEDWLNDQGYEYQSLPSGNATVCYEHARDHLLENVDTESEKWMMHIHVKEPHAAYDPPEEYLDGLSELPESPWDLTNKDYHYDAAKTHWDDLSEEEKDLLLSHLLVRYEGEMRYLDDQLAAMWADLEQRGLLDDTLVVFFTDHGEAFWEHDIHTHAYSMYREENDAIAFFWRKNLVPMAWEGPTNHADLVPTVLTALGMDIPRGVTGLPVGSAPDDRIFYYDAIAQWGMVQAVRQGDLKMMYRWNTGEKWLYDLSVDPGETNNIYDADDPRVIAFWEHLLPITENADKQILEHSASNPGP